MLNVLFYHGLDTIKSSDNKNQNLYLSIVILYLKTYIDINKPGIADQINWILPEQHKISDEELINLCYDNKVDILCTSHNIWSDAYVHAQLLRIKNKLPPNTKVVVGGPNIDVHTNKQFFSDRPYVDYAIYGAGEVAFGDLIESIILQKKLITLNTSNIAWFNKKTNKLSVAKFSYVPITKVSPYTHNALLLEKMIAKERSKGINITLIYELTRGCPYSCTFCDWNQGLSNKVSRRRETYKDEIDLFHKLGIKDLFLADANTGQYAEDIEMVEYLVEKNLKEKAGFIVDANYSKLQKKNNLKIYHLLAKGKLVNRHWGFTLSVQDINKQVLENIDRPDIGWDEHVKIIQELTEAYPWSFPKVQLIMGLPGQTVNTWRNTLREVAKNKVYLIIFINEILPASPAILDPEYQRKFQYDYSTSERYAGNDQRFIYGKFPKSCVSFSSKDFVKMVLLSTIYTALTIIRNSEFHTDEFDLEEVVDNFLVSKEYQELYNNLLDNWENKDKFYYTKTFGGNNMLVSACQIDSTAGDWIRELSFVKFLSKHYKKPNPVIIKELLNWKDKTPWEKYDTID